MILPGHIAASVLCHRYLKVDLRIALLAGITPDVVDKVLYYGFHVTPSSRVPMHTLLSWLVSTVLLLLIAYISGKGAIHVWPGAWFAGYGAHLLCDSPLVGGALPFLWPLIAYDFSSPHLPLGFVFGLDDWPLVTLLAEAGLAGLTIRLERKWIASWIRRQFHQSVPDRR